MSKDLDVSTEVRENFKEIVLKELTRDQLLALARVLLIGGSVESIYLQFKKITGVEDYEVLRASDKIKFPEKLIQSVRHLMCSLRSFRHSPSPTEMLTKSVCLQRIADTTTKSIRKYAKKHTQEKEKQLLRTNSTVEAVLRTKGAPDDEPCFSAGPGVAVGQSLIDALQPSSDATDSYTDYKNMYRKVQGDPRNPLLLAKFRLAAFEDAADSFEKVYRNTEWGDRCDQILLTSVQAYILTHHSENAETYIWFMGYDLGFLDGSDFGEDERVTPEIVAHFADIVISLYNLRHTPRSPGEITSVYRSLDVDIGLLSSKVNRLLTLEEVENRESSKD